jgi:hypothetical protein
MFALGTVHNMFRVEIDVTLVGSQPLTSDDVTDLIELLIDELDTRAVDPSVSTHQLGDSVHVSVALTVDSDEEFDALTTAVADLQAALRVVNVGLSRPAAPRDVQSRVLPLQAA